MENSGNLQDILVPPVEGVAGGGTAYGWDDGGLRNLSPLKGSIDPSEVPTTDLVHVWCLPNTTNVGPQEMPRHLEPINLLAARNERESVQIAIRPKVSWVGSGGAGTVLVQCSDLSSASGDRLVVGNSLTLRRVVPILGIPDALVPLNLPVSQINLFPGDTTAIWVSIDVPSTQPPGQYEGDIIITAAKPDTESSAQCLSKADKYKLYKELQSCLEMMGPVDDRTSDGMVERVKSASTSLRSVLLSPLFSEFSDNGPVDLMDEDAISNLSLRVKINLTVWDFVLPTTPSLPAVFGISDTVIEDRFGVVHGSKEWYEALEQHFKWLLQFRISPYFCRWGDSMRVLTYTSPWPADHPKSDEYFSEPRLAAYAVPYSRVISGDASKESLQKQIEILRTKTHWKKAYFYLWDEPLNMEQYDSLRNLASEIHAYAPDARVLTTYYSGPSDAPLAPTAFEAFVKVPKFLRPHTQIYCTSEWVLGNREDLVKDIISELQPEDGEEWWTYVCMGPSDPHPNWHLGMRGTQHRAVMWRVWKEGGTGFLYWGANCYEKATVPSEEIRFRRGLPPGDGVLFYPGEVFSSSHVPVASLRLERILSGLQDIEYLKLFSSRYGRDEGLALLEKTGVYLGPERYTHEHMPIEVMRAGHDYDAREALTALVKRKSDKGFGWE
uniref:Glycoside hydrolase 123 catalytic domain-containing protein n=1 Tax=Cannabis sativa TaxID=3483 RepID=A0A803NMZ1_CANSA